MHLALTDPEVIKLGTLIVGALAAAVSALWWRSERAHERHHKWSENTIETLLAQLERRRETDHEVAATLRGITCRHEEGEKPKEGS